MLKSSTKYLQIICKFGIGEVRYANYRVAVGPLIGQGWELRRSTLPKLYVNKARPKVLVFFTFEQSAYGKRMAKNNVPHQSHLPPCPPID